jgi:Holliday junction resolvase
VDERQRVSRKQETQVSNRFSARRHAGSGSGHRKHDMHTEETLIECKTVLSGNRQITIHEDDLKSLKYNAAIQDRSPMMHIRIAKENWVLIPETRFYELTE